MKPNIIVEKAIGRLLEQTGILATWTPEKDEIDGRIAFTYNRERFHLPVEVKKELRAHQLPALIGLRTKYGQLLLMAEYIYPKLKDQLRVEGIAYLETNGNVYIKQNNLFLWVENGKAERQEKVAAGRAFAKTGLKLLFHFLIEPDLINCTYRKIAEKTGVGFGNINFIVTDLKEQGFLLPKDKETYFIVRKKELLYKWMEGYKEKLKPALELGRFRFTDKENYFRWEDLALKPGETWWGGEPAGDMLTHYLKPEVLTLYTTQKRLEIMKTYKLIPDKQGDLQLFQKFWQFTERGPTVPPLLAYVDLMNTGDRRCIETAEKIYHEHLQDKF